MGRPTKLVSFLRSVVQQEVRGAMNNLVAELPMRKQRRRQRRRRKNITTPPTKRLG